MPPKNPPHTSPSKTSNRQDHLPPKIHPTPRKHQKHQMLRTWEIARKVKFPKVVRGAKGLLDPACDRPLALARNGVGPVQKRVWVVQKTLGRPLLPKPKRVKPDLLHPPLTTFGDFPFWAISQLHSIPTQKHQISSPCTSGTAFAQHIQKYRERGLLERC